MTMQSSSHTDPVFTLGDYLAKARDAAGLSQQDMADRLLISRATVVNWENGHTRPSDRKVAAWALATGVRVEWLRRSIAPPAGPAINWFGRIPQARRPPRPHLRILGSPVNHPSMAFHPFGALSGAA